MKDISLHFIRHAPVITADGVFYGSEAQIDENCENLLTSAAVRLPKTQLWLTSEFHRAIRTADLLQQHMNISVSRIIDPAFNEQDFGFLVGKSRAQIREDLEYAAYLKDKIGVAPPGGESVLNMIDRARTGIQNLSLKMRERSLTDAIVICHGGIISAAYHIFHETPFDRKLNVPYLSVHTFLALSDTPRIEGLAL